MNEKTNQTIEMVGNLLSEGRVLTFPSIGEYPVYDALSYSMMMEDTRKINAYENALRNAVQGKTVVEVGTGAMAPLALACVRAGAQHVYAIEIDEQAVERARSVVAEAGFAEHITVIQGDATQVVLPEQVDVCVSEIIGNIGGAEGAATILKNAKRFFKPSEGMMLPKFCSTQMAPAILPDDVHQSEEIHDLIDEYVARIFRALGETFPLTRFVYYNFPEENLICMPQTFECDDFNGILQEAQRRSLAFQVPSKARMDGFVLWVNLQVDGDNVIDAFKGYLSWAPVFLKTRPFNLEKNDQINALCERNPGANGVNPDYTIKASIMRGGRQIHAFTIDSPHMNPK